MSETELPKFKMDDESTRRSLEESDLPSRPHETALGSVPLHVREELKSAAADDIGAEATQAALARSANLRESPLHDVFIGSTSIYPGTRWLIYLGISFAIFQVEGWMLFPLRSHVADLWWRMIIEVGMMLAAIVPGFVMARIEHRRFEDFGLPARRAFGRNFWVGSLWGIASLTVLIVALRIAGAFEFGSLALHGARIWKFAAYYAVFFLITGLFEDFLMRGYSQWVLSQGMNFWPAAAVLSCVFGAIHGTNAGEAKTGLIAAGLIGFFLCLTLRRTGDLWWAIGFHMAWDWGESFLYSVPDSGTLLPGHLLNSNLHGPEWLTGGTVGPEGSYLVFAVIGGLWVLFDRAYPEVRNCTPLPPRFPLTHSI